MAIKKLVVDVIELSEEETWTYRPGYRYACFKDPETGKYYQPNVHFEVAGENLDELFDLVETEVVS
jgi:hypothetical protein